MMGQTGTPSIMGNFMGGGLIGNMVSMMGGSPDRKSGLSLLNPSMKKMAGGAASQGGILRSKAPSARGSQGGRSRRTGYSQTKSRTSKHEEDWDSMDITEIDVLIETHEKEMEQAMAEIRKIKRNKTIPANQKEVKCEPFEDVLKQIRM